MFPYSEKLCNKEKTNADIVISFFKSRIFCLIIIASKVTLINNEGIQYQENIWTKICNVLKQLVWRSSRNRRPSFIASIGIIYLKKINWYLHGFIWVSITDLFSFIVCIELSLVLDGTIARPLFTVKYKVKLCDINNNILASYCFADFYPPGFCWNSLIGYMNRAWNTATGEHETRQLVKTTASTISESNHLKTRNVSYCQKFLLFGRLSIRIRIQLQCEESIYGYPEMILSFENFRC